MKFFALLPLISFGANLSLAIYIIKNKTKNLTNWLYCLAAWSLAAWALADFFKFSSPTLQIAFFWDKLGTISSTFTGFFLLYFFLQFTNYKNITHKIFITLLFLPVLFFTITDLIWGSVTTAVKTEWWGYSGTAGLLYTPYIIFLVIYICIGIYHCVLFYKKSKLSNERKQILLLIIAMCIPLVGGVLTEAIPVIMRINTVPPLTSTLTTFTAVIIAYAISKYQLLALTVAVAADTIIDTMADSLLVLDKDWIIKSVNNATQTILGYDKKYLINKPADLIFNEKEKDLQLMSAELVRNDNVFNFKTTFLTNHKNKIPISFNAATIKNARNEIIGIIGVARDITEQLNAEAELKRRNEDIEKQRLAILNILEDVAKERDISIQQRDKINIILKSIGDGVIVVDQEQKIEFINPIAEDLTGWPLKEAIGIPAETVFNIFDETNMEKRQSPISEAIETGQIKNLSNHTVLKTKDDQIIPIADSAAPIKNAQGNISGAVLVFRDMIQERIAEEKVLHAKTEIEKLNQQLDVKVEQKTKELREAYDDLKELDSLKDEFLNISAHELKTPLTSIIGLSEIMILKKQGAINIKQKKSLIIVNNEANRLLNIIKKILGITRIEAGKAIFDLQKTDLCLLATKMINSLKPLAVKQNVELVYQKPNKPIWVKVDAERIQEVIYNLIDNALKFSPPDSKIFISGETKAKNFIFSVKDQGPGIDPAKKDKLFQKFSQLDTGFSRKQEGTGLGLYISKITVENMGGKIWAESEFGKGANFKFSLPLAK